MSVHQPLETGAAHHLRDSRIAPIYEGTNGIQAMDLVGRKLTLRGGEAVREWLGAMKALERDLGAFPTIKANLATGAAALERTTRWVVGVMDKDPNAALAGATPYLRMFGIVSGGYLLARQAVAAAAQLAAKSGDAQFLAAKITTAKFFAEQILPQAAALEGPVTAGAELLYALTPEQLASA